MRSILKDLTPFAVALALVSLLAITFLSLNPFQAIGSVEQTHEYTATTTAANVLYGNTITGSKLIKSGTGALGSIVITGANTGLINVYNATTSNVALRGNKASTTILIATIPASAAAGTYTFDAAFSDGLYLDLVSGSMPTTTVTYR